ncbi:NAD(P)-binding protein [Thozetella sp. PMI_491]|nr:NAD(P)-binding protein [Thozetella sp. PMI_491]
MATKIFLTGYIGGDIFHELYKTHPDFDYTLLVRSPERAKVVQGSYPGSNVHFVYGTLDSADVIEKAAAEADIVIHTADSADDVPSATAIAKGVAAGHSAEKPGYWIHLCGTGILQWYDETNKRYGQPPLPEEAYNDIKDIDRILNLPDQALHRDVDKIVLAANQSPAVKTAIVGPATIYGAGRGPGNKDSQQVYSLARFALKNGFTPVVGTGKVEWDNVHIQDVSSLFILLVDAALDPQKNQNQEIFGTHGYFFNPAGTHTWGEVAEQVAEEVVKQRYLAEAPLRTVKYEDIPNKSLGTNSKSVGERASKFLGWKPTGPSLKDEVPGIVAVEARKLGLNPIQ